MMELLLLAFFSDSVDVFVNDFMLERRVQYQFSFLIFVFVDADTEDCLFIQAWKVSVTAMTFCPWTSKLEAKNTI